MSRSHHHPLHQVSADRPPRPTSLQQLHRRSQPRCAGQHLKYQIVLIHAARAIKEIVTAAALSEPRGKRACVGPCEPRRHSSHPAQTAPLTLVWKLRDGHGNNNGEALSVCFSWQIEHAANLRSPMSTPDGVHSRVHPDRNLAGWCTYPGTISGFPLSIHDTLYTALRSKCAARLPRTYLGLYQLIMSPVLGLNRPNSHPHPTAER